MLSHLVLQVRTSTCGDGGEECIAFGPGKDMWESTKIIAKRQVSKAKVKQNKKLALQHEKGKMKVSKDRKSLAVSLYLVLFWHQPFFSGASKRVKGKWETVDRSCEGCAAVDKYGQAEGE